jgi:hypothetical protein
MTQTNCSKRIPVLLDELGGLFWDVPLVLSIAWLLCDTGAVVRHGIYAGRRRGSDRFPLGRNGPWRSKVALVFSDDLNGYLGPVLSGGPV